MMVTPAGIKFHLLTPPFKQHTHKLDYVLQNATQTISENIHRCAGRLYTYFFCHMIFEALLWISVAETQRQTKPSQRQG